MLLRLLPYTARWRLYGGVRVRPASSGAVPARVARAACAHVGRATSAACLSSVTAAQWCPACVPSRISPRVVQQVLPPTHARAGGRSHKHLSAGVAPACQYAAELACSQTRMAFALLCAGARCHVDNPGARGSGRARRRPRRARRCWPARPRWRRASAARCCGACASSPTSARSGARGCHSRACSPRSRTPMRSRCSTPSSAWRAPAQYLFFFFFHLQVKNKYCHVSGSKAGGGGGCACMRASVRRPISAAFSPMRALEMTASTCTSRCGGGSGGVSQQGGAVHAGCQT